MKVSLLHTLALLGFLIAGSIHGMGYRFTGLPPKHQFTSDLEYYVTNNNLTQVQQLCAENAAIVADAAKEHSSDVYRSLGHAIKHNHVEMLQFLLTAFGPYVLLEENCYEAAQKGINPAILDCIVKHLQAQHPESWQHHLACGITRGIHDIYAVEQLINAGADVNTHTWDYPSSYATRDTISQTPLHIAVTNALRKPRAGNRYIPAVELLLKHGARTDIKDRNGKTVVELCEVKGMHKDTLRAIRDMIAPKHEMIAICDVTQFPRPLGKLVAEYAYADDQELLDACEACATDPMARRVLHLLESGCRANISNSNGKRALHYAAQCGNEQAVEYLLKHNATLIMPHPKNTFALIPMCDEHGTTPLHLAAEQGSPEVVALLLQANTFAAVNAQTTYSTQHSINRRFRVRDPRAGGKRYRFQGGKAEYIEETAGTTALMRAADQAHPAVVELLLQHRADTNLVDASGKKASTYAQESEITGDGKAKCIALLHE
ncbi:MAG: ankyrin repeat domain-containing protein [Candidatus Babeliales bacterium]